MTKATVTYTTEVVPAAPVICANGNTAKKLRLTVQLYSNATDNCLTIKNIKKAGLIHSFSFKIESRKCHHAANSPEEKCFQYPVRITGSPSHGLGQYATEEITPESLEQQITWHHSASIVFITETKSPDK